jgi:hypothetical protein
MMQTDVKSARIVGGSTNTAAFAGSARIKGLVVSHDATGGLLTITNGSGGSTVFMFGPGAYISDINIVIPGEGILCTNGIYVTTSTKLSVIVFYG